MNTLAYIIYLSLTYVITVHVGLRFYKHGRLYISNLLAGDEALTNFINKMLLIGYYLLNLGYASLMLHSWRTVYDWTGLVASVGVMTGKILLTLAVMHFFNMYGIYLIGKNKKYFNHHKTINNENRS